MLTILDQIWYKSLPNYNCQIKDALLDRNIWLGSNGSCPVISHDDWIQRRILTAQVRNTFWPHWRSVIVGQGAGLAS